MFFFFQSQHGKKKGNKKITLFTYKLLQKLVDQLTSVVVVCRKKMYSSDRKRKEYSTQNK